MVLVAPWMGGLIPDFPVYTITFNLGAGGFAVDTNGNPVPAAINTIAIPVRLHPATFDQAAKIIQLFPGADIDSQFFKGWVNHQQKYSFAHWSPTLTGVLQGEVTIDDRSGHIECRVINGDPGMKVTGQQFVAKFAPAKQRTSC